MTMSTHTQEKNRLLERLNELRNDLTRPLEEILIDAANLADEAQKIGELETECEILIFLGKGYRLGSKAFKSINALNRAYITLNNNFYHNKELLAQIYRELSNVYANSLHDFETAIEYSKKGYKLNVKALNPVFLNNTGSNCISMKLYAEATQYLREGIKTLEDPNNWITLFLHHNLANALGHLGEKEQALEMFDNTLKKYDELLTPHTENLEKWSMHYIKSYSYYELAQIHFASKDYVKARESIASGKAFSIETEQHLSLSVILFLEGKILLKENKIEEFNALYAQAIELCDKHEFLVDKQNWLALKQEYLENSGDYQSALALSKEQNVITEKIYAAHKEIDISKMLVNKEEQILSLENKNRIMKLQQEELQQFAYIVTHDLKSPLSTISNFSGLVNMRYKDILDAQGREYLDYIIVSAKKLTLMLSDLMQYISFDKSIDSENDTYEIKDVVESVLTANGLKSDQYSLQIIGVEKANIRGFHLEILLDNLIRNAIKFQSEERPLFLNITVENDSDNQVFTLADNGIGISDPYKQQIFQIFKRLNQNSSDGTGIGLSICKKIVQNYMGKIWVEDNKPNGAQFRFSFPLSSGIELYS